MTISKPALRAALRDRRRGLPADSAGESALRVCERIAGLGWLAVRHVAVYRAFDGELDAEPLAVLARAGGATTWYPVVDGDEMRFVSWDGESPLRIGAFGIEEPERVTPSTLDRPTLDPAELDLVVLPVVGFDSAGHRLGMGRGYYDRTFAFVKQSAAAGSAGARPRLIAIAFDEQEVDAIAGDPWDVAVDAIVTPTRVVEPRR